MVHLWNFSNCCTSLKHFLMLIKKHTHVSEPTQFKLVLFKSQWYLSGAPVKLKQLKGRSFSFVSWQVFHNYDWLSRAPAKGHISVAGEGGLCSLGESWMEQFWRQINPLYRDSSSPSWHPSGCFVCCERQTGVQVMLCLGYIPWL